jgi:hypothetical protein
LQTNRKWPSAARTASYNGWGEQIVAEVAEINRFEVGILAAMCRQPAMGGAAFAILLLRPDLFRAACFGARSGV